MENMDTEKLIPILLQAGSFIAAFAAIAAGVIMSQVTKKFGTGILASSFRTTSVGVFFIAAGIILDAVNSYFQISSNVVVVGSIVMIKELCFVIGTYTIVIGSKQTGDKIESLTK